jgi:uncharacterized protein YgbK (DUF1537 family)
MLRACRTLRGRPPCSQARARARPWRKSHGCASGVPRFWAEARLGDGPILISASAPPQDVAATQARFGAQAAGERIERVLAEIARGLLARGVRRFVVAGGETSGAVVQALGVGALRIGRQIDPGVPWTVTLGEPTVALALKSGNFGSEDFFLRAIEVAP